MLRNGHFRIIQHKGIGIINDFTVLDPHNTVGIRFRQFRVMRNHDHQTISGYLFQQFHNLHTGFGVQRAGGFVCQQNIRIVNQCTGNGYTLHLATGHLIGLLVKLIAQANRLQRFGCPSATLRP